MAIQNMYNNYINRQKQNSTGQFRQKVANSLGGKPVGNNTTKKPAPGGLTSPTGVPTVYQQSMTIPGSQVAPPKPNPVQPRVAPQSSTINSKPIAPNNGVNTPIQLQNPVQPNLTPQNPNMGGEQTGMMAIGDMREQMQAQPTPQPTPQDIQQINEMANDPMVQQQAYSQGKTPQQMAQELLDDMKKQAQADWEQKRKELEEQMKQTEASMEQSKNDANNIYKETEQTLNESRYQQQQDLAVSGANRGIQYSPQQLGLEQVANITHNKNLADASNKRNELLNNLTIEMNKVMANINLGLQGATNEYNRAVAEMTASYQKQMMDWEWDDQKTKEEREWQEKQAQADKDFQKQMQEMQNAWQEKQNALDREKNGRSGGGGGYSYGGGGRSYSAYRRGRSSAWNNYGSYGDYANSPVGENDIEGQLAMQNVMEENSTDMFNAFKVGTTGSLDERAQLYKDEMANMTNQMKQYGLNKDGQKRSEDIQNVAIEKLFKRNEFSTYGKPYKMSGNNSDALLESKVHKPYKPSVNHIKDRVTAKADYDKKYSTDGKKKAMSMLMGSKGTLKHSDKIDWKQPNKTVVKGSGTTDPKEVARQNAQKKLKSNVKKVSKKVNDVKKKAVKKPTYDPKEQARKNAKSKFNNFKKKVSSIFKKKDKKKKKK